MNKFQELELKCVIENIELELEFQDLTEEEQKAKIKDLKTAKDKLKQING
jgi:hypothetical protein